jgi:ceramide glucosyltransferase
MLDSAAHLLSTIGDGALAAYLVILGVKFALSRRYAATHREDSLDEAPVTILQPILSCDPSLEETLRRNLQQASPSARFLWLIDEDDAEAHRLTGRLRDESDGRVDILVCPPAVGDVNPKTLKLQHGLAAVATPYLAVLDDDTLLAEDNLGRAVFALRSCALYTGLPCYLPGRNFWSAMVAYFVNNNSILTYLPLLPLVGPLTINGMFYVMRTQTVNDMGGFTPILDQLCDDYALARHVRARGGVIRQAATPHFLRTTVQGPGPYFRLMHRWFVFARVLVSDQPARVALLLFVFLVLPPLLLWLGLLSLFGGLPSALLLAATLVLRHLALRRLHRTVFGGLSPFNPLMSILAELLQPLHGLHACLQTEMRWRTRRIRLGRGGTFSYLPGPDS